MRILVGLALLGATACTPGVGTDGGSGEVGTSTGPASDASSVGASSQGADSRGASGTTTGVAVTDTGTGDVTGDVTDTGTAFPPPVPDDCITDVTAGHHVYMCSDLAWDVEIPVQCLDAPCGMIFDVHGLTMSADMQDANTDMRARGREHGYIVVQPNAQPAPPAASWNPDVDDGKVFDFMQRTAAAFHVDPDRWHVTGFSQGGFMSWRFVCAHADVLASAAPGAACGNDFPIADCQFTADEAPSEPIDILYMHGTADVVVGYACAQPRRDAVIAHFGLGEGELVEQDDDHRWTRYTGDGMVFEYLEHDYSGVSLLAGGHCFPGSDDTVGELPGQIAPFACQGPDAFVWGEVVMQFFVDHPRD